MIGIGIIIPVIPTLITDLTGKGLSEAARIGGFLMLAFSATQFVFSPLLGKLSDKFGRRPILLISLFGLAIDYLFHAFAPTIGWLFVGRILAGLTGASYTVAMAYVADVSTSENKSKNFGIVGSAFGLGFIIGPIIGGYFGEDSYQVPFFIAAGLTMLNFLYGLFILPESHPPERRVKKIGFPNPLSSIINLRKYKEVSALILAFFLVHIGGNALPATWTFFTELKFGWSESQVGESLTVVGVLVAFVQGFLTGKLVNWIGNRKTLIFGFIMWPLGMSLFGFASEGWMLYVFTIPYCLGGVAGPTLQGFISNEVPNDQQGELQGALASLMNLAMIISLPVMTEIFRQFTVDEAPIHFPGAPYILSATLMIVAFLIVIFRFFAKNDDSAAVDTLNDA